MVTSWAMKKTSDVRSTTQNMMKRPQVVVANLLAAATGGLTSDTSEDHDDKIKR